MPREYDPHPPPTPPEYPCETPGRWAELCWRVSSCDAGEPPLHMLCSPCEVPVRHLHMMKPARTPSTGGDQPRLSTRSPACRAGRSASVGQRFHGPAEDSVRAEGLLHPCDGS